MVPATIIYTFFSKPKHAKRNRNATKVSGSKPSPKAGDFDAHDRRKNKMKSGTIIAMHSLATFFLGIGLGTLKTANLGEPSTSLIIAPIALGSAAIIITTSSIKNLLTKDERRYNKNE